MDFQNKEWNGIYYSRIIASWVRVGGSLKDGGKFRKWMKSIGIPEETVWDIYNLATNGKLELQTSALKFIRDNK